MNGIALNSDNFLQDNAEVLALWFSAGEGSGDVLPYHKSRSYRASCSPSKFIVCSQLLYYPDLLHEKAGTRTGKPGARSGDGEVLTRAAAADDVHGRQQRAIEFCDVPDVDHAGKVVFGYFDGKGFDFTRPQRHDAMSHRGQREAPDPIEEAAHCEHFLFLLRYFAAARIVRVVLTAVCAV